ncbi:diguanylate cyclase (GGDEF)-like protein/PAS domain S-box-containing protein [Acidovorax delafieldii]|uniref:Diguanylate cyclase (GGDEF)-like protein/PAS domain S-box-containing protein n=1 Tax=Acidovorax delafieldii TaxID=47920 RepID=A0AAJ2F3H8_ACIDE|nr:EAL domain-containing protein [Acidovorax delafieldii]MDR6768869.1 diguanylate cyclase (GGDEF)-like protein/PAS domain S-box-containing protein [Acidovorax delafieldii]MDR6839246.1 diguanylate cyclase (GGDEF)-like protein/PAS domain S-box-containing protein [Acidovorax delafieldii]MDR7368797.1 diguanylate cyclase (GGDEF)-like protein/PAS domain S-box-containing protein [Acidovorax delafieldii]
MTATLADAPLRRALDASDNAVVMTNSSKRVVYVNEGFTRLFGYQPAEVLGKLLSEVLLGPHSDPDLLESIRGNVLTQGSFHGDTLLYSKAGQPRWVSLVINASDESSGGPGGSISILTDITLTKMHEVLQTHVLEGMVNELPLHELMALVCREVERIAPEVTATILAVDAQGRLHPLAAPSLPASISRALDGLAIGPTAGSCGTAAFRNEPVVVTDMATDPLWDDYRELFAPSGMRACWSSPIRDHRGQPIGTFAFYFREPRAPDALHQRLVDVCLHLCALAIERDSTHQRIHQLAFFDVLTGLPNRALFRTSAERALGDLRRGNHTGALLFLDLDRFKQVNDTQGHAAGDALLSEVAQRLAQGLRARDLIARLSGDEFVLLLSECTTEQAVQSAHRVLHDIAQPLDIFGQTHVPHASLGIAMFPNDGDTIDTLLRHADQAMHQAKSDHRHSLQLFSAEMNRRAQERASLERALQQALSDRSLMLHYQPQVLSSSPGTLHGVEALARWNHPQWGMVPPSQFIPVAEDAGLIHELTLWLLDEACRQLAAWRAAGHDVPCVAVNLSGRSFHRPEFAQEISDALQRHGLRASDVLLEITESVMMDARPVTLQNIEALHHQGFKLSLDDFGTGYSSLSYLHRLPISELKLDMAFVQDLTTSATARALTVSVLSIAHSLGMVVVAEGVETIGQQQWLQTHGCPVMQGYLFGKPLPPDEIEAWLCAQAPRPYR